MVYVLLLERIERHMAITIAFAAAGAEAEDQPSWSFSQDSVDSWLADVPAQDTEQDELLRALGVR